MRWLLSLFLPVFLLAGAVSAGPASSGSVEKVLPHYLDLKGRHSVLPSLYDRDLYQAELRLHPEKRSGLRFDILWKARNVKEPKLRVELRGVPKGKSSGTRVLEEPVKSKSRFGTWSGITLKGQDYKEFGEVTAWRVSLWDGKYLMGVQQSFLW
jgi:hypothetical protein